MQDEAIRRNMALREEDRVKNLVWAVVCRKGDRRLVVCRKGDRRLLMRFADREIERMRTSRGWEANRGAATPCMGQRQPATERMRQGDSRSAPRGWGGGGKEGKVQEVGTRMRLNSKWTRLEKDAEEMPMAKH
jgi:hypothetical protein